ncbi:DUF2304 domain-containing protein [Embleya hyalina]|uniref:DUF2304 domain-containing protein n=1 Tax=Embleya hyalina TaxID=516124 RepID=A0A401YI77_9ACTN|nr:DUF2304 domain-containing protein [Embleya hyalina]GCD94300.1 hypothetical protein EHYA_01960 [Embleya hyalina]
MVIQIFLLLCAAGLLTTFVLQWDRVRTRAWKRIAFLLFVGTNVYAVLRPNDITWMANRVGVGRGTDLIIYLLVVGVAFMTLNTYLRFRSLERKLTELARNVALRDARELNAGRVGLPAIDLRTARRPGTR